VSCRFSKQQLALHAEGDLPEAAAQLAARHLAACEDCRRFLDRLAARQALLKTLRRERFSPSECTGMRRGVMAIIDDRRDRAGWVLRLERAIVLGLRPRSYALAAFALLGLVSVSVLAQMRHASLDANAAAAVFEGRDTLLRPDGYRDWIVLDPSTKTHRLGADNGSTYGSTHDSQAAGHSVYINPSGYREYVKTGVFPEGTLMVWESLNPESEAAGRPHRQSPALLASVKDSARFDGGWGFFDFTGTAGSVTTRAQALLDSSGCRSCHRQEAETDHVFTQFYPELRSARHGAQLAVPPPPPSSTERPALPRRSRFQRTPPVARA
jgi:hypothetical protein